MSLQALQKLMIGSVASLDDVTDETIHNLGLTEEQIDMWHKEIEEARDRYIAAVLSIEQARDRYIEAVLSIDKILEQ